MQISEAKLEKKLVNIRWNYKQKSKGKLNA